MRIGIAAACAALLLLVAACGGGGGGGSSSGGGGSGGGGGGGTPPPAPNQPPVANAGEGFTAAIHPAGYQLDGSKSADPEGAALNYVWSIQSRPGGADATISGVNTPIAQLQAMAPGSYVIGLSVTDPAGAAATATATVTLTNDPPEAVAEASLMMPAVGEEVLLNGGGSSDVNGHSLSYTWRLTQAPSGSNLRTSFQGAVVPIVFDVEGEYGFSLEVSDGYDTTTAALAPVLVSAYSIQRLNAPFRHVAEQPGGGVIVSAHERSFMVIRDGQEAAVITLPETATAVAVSPDGRLAAVGHLTSVSVVDLSSYAVLSTLEAGTDVVGVSVADDGFVYTWSSSSTSWRNVIAISPTGVVRNAASIFSGSDLKMHPSGTKMYTVDRSVSPADVRRLNIDSGSVPEVRDSPYHGGYNFCGELWIASDGGSLLTRCGLMLRATENPLTDMTYFYQIGAGSGPGTISIMQAAHSRLTNRWFVVPEASLPPYGAIEVSPTVRVYSAPGGSPLATLPLPVSETGRQLYARTVSPSQTEDVLYILAQDHPTNPQAYYVLKSIVPVAPPLDYPPEMIVQKYSAGLAGEPVRIDAGASFDPEGRPLSFEWALVSQPSMSALVLPELRNPALVFTPVVAGAYVFTVTASDGERVSAPQTVTVNVAGSGASMMYRMEGNPADWEYSKSLNLLAYIADNKRELRLLSLGDLSERRIDLPREGFRVGISPDGRRAAVSHTGLATLINLETGTLAGSQEYSADWGDIVLDRRYRAHIIPRMGQWASIVSIDFSTSSTGLSAWSSFAGSQLRMHPNGDWLYSATIAVSPSRFEKWITSVFPATNGNRLPYHGTYDIAGNVWVSEDGDAILAAGGDLFRASSDASVDMYYLDTLENNPGVIWADHSTERNQWAVAGREAIGGGQVVGKIYYYTDSTFEREGALDVAAIPDASGLVTGDPIRVFFSDDGETTLVVTDSLTLADRVALQISGP